MIWIIIILRAGELHIVMSQLRTIGEFIENSGLDLAWTEADLYGSATVKQILEGKHVRRGIEAHLVTVEVLFSLFQDTFFQHYPEVVDKLASAAEQLTAAWSNETCDVVAAHDNMVTMLESLQVMEKMTEFKHHKDRKPLSQVMNQYMEMVMNMLQFIRSVRTGNWDMHLLSMKTFVKYYFAHDKLNYARMIPVYLADMQALLILTFIMSF